MVDGSFEFDTRPVVEIEVEGITGNKKKFIAKIDTGYDGYLQIPLTEGFPIGLVLKGTQTYTVASGDSTTHLVCLGEVKIGIKSEVVPIDLSPNSKSILLGTYLLKDLNAKLIVNYSNPAVKISYPKPTKSTVLKPQVSKKK
jgi:predicted aspartyl protease